MKRVYNGFYADKKINPETRKQFGNSTRLALISDLVGKYNELHSEFRGEYKDSYEWYENHSSSGYFSEDLALCMGQLFEQYYEEEVVSIISELKFLGYDRLKSLPRFYY